ncbi:unnamed protein product [Malus baccata var. baccata]
MGDKPDSRSTIQGTTVHSKWKNPNHPLYLHHSDHPGAIIVLQPLVEDNNNIWVQSMNMALTVKNKLGLGQDMAVRFHVEKDFREHHQLQGCSTDVHRFVGEVLTSEYACSCGTKNEMTSYVETQKTMKFLIGLNESYDTVQSNTLLLEPLPTVNKAYMLALQHECQAEVSNGKSTRPEAAVFAVKNSSREPALEDNEEDCKQILQMLNKNKSSFANQVGNPSSHEELSGPSLEEDDWEGN